MAKKSDLSGRGEHTHLFTPTFDQSVSRCVCGKYAMSRAEYERRQSAWDTYYEKVRTTDAYKLAKRMEHLVNTMKHRTPNCPNIDTCENCKERTRIMDHMQSDKYISRPRLQRPPFPDLDERLIEITDEEMDFDRDYKEIVNIFGGTR